MKNSSKPRKQRKYRYNSPMHKRQDMVCAHLSKELRKSIGKRTLRVKKGYVVKVLRGSNKGKEGKITRVSLNTLKVYIEGITRKKSDGKEVPLPIDPSNVVITRLSTEVPVEKK
ncbi:MAG: 50S ribosomal protein L24 [Candidatus Micrarchaeia archaeon]